MRVIARVIGSAATAMALALAGSAVAQADDASFVRDVQVLGARHSAENLISTGRSACYFLSRNRDPGQIAERISRYLLITPDQAQRYLALSVGEYCPDRGGQIGL